MEKKKRIEGKERRGEQMEKSVLLEAKEWAKKTFGSVRLGDIRRTQRAVSIAEAMARNPSATLPRQMGNEASLHAAYRFLQTPDVQYERLIGPHLHQTREVAGQKPRVLLIQDTTEADYQHHPTTTGLGPVGNGSHHGFLLQSVLAVVPESGEVLGLAHQEPFLRKPVPKGETKRERAKRERESQVWERSVQAIGSPPAGVQWIHVGDRGADIFSFLWLCQSLSTDYVIRAAQDRCIDLEVEDLTAPVVRPSHHKRGEDEPGTVPSLHLFEVARSWKPMGHQELELPATKDRKARTAHLSISYGKVRLLPPTQGPARALPPLLVWVVHAWEASPPEGQEALEWVLLTSVSVESLEEGSERIEWYRRRWIVEDYHQGLKTGCQIEQRQLQDYEGLRRLLGFLAPLAVRLLQIRSASRESPDTPASAVLPLEIVRVVAHQAGVAPFQLTVQQCWYTIAKAGGYLARRGDGPPGWKTLWLGWFYFQTLIEGIHLAALLSLE
jgi:transposase-like protein